MQAREDPDVMYSRSAWLAAIVTLGVCGVARATSLYDNTVNDTGQSAVLSGNTWADDIHMSSGGLVRLVEFGYVANYATQATISFYTNDAANSIFPGDGAQLLLLRVVAIEPESSGLGVLLLDPPVELPQHMWYAIRFNNFNGAVPLFDPPVIGTSNDVVVRGNGSFWNGTAPRNYFGAGHNNFEIRIGLDIPTPGSLTLLGGSCLLIGRRPRRR